MHAQSRSSNSKVEQVDQVVVAMQRLLAGVEVIMQQVRSEVGAKWCLVCAAAQRPSARQRGERA